MKIQCRLLLLTLDTVLQYTRKNKQLHFNLKLKIYIVTITGHNYTNEHFLGGKVFRKAVDQPCYIQYPKEYCMAPRNRKPTALNGGKQFQ